MQHILNIKYYSWVDVSRVFQNTPRCSVR